MHTTEAITSTYDKHKNLKLAADELGMKWQTLYWRLKKVNHAVVGNKLEYGTEKDKFARKAELYFLNLIPSAKDLNQDKFQAKYDFNINSFKVDVKSARPKRSSHRSESLRWAFSVKKQEVFADFIICMCCDEDGNVIKILLLPSEAIKKLQTISVSINGKSKWNQYEISESDLVEFFTKTIVN